MISALMQSIIATDGASADLIEPPSLLFRGEASGHLDYVKRNLIEKWFQTLAMGIDRFHQTWMGARASAAR